MSHVERIYLYWKRKVGSKDGETIRTPRLIDVGIKYFQPGEYVDPIVGRPIKYKVTDMIWRERQATWGWQPRERLEVWRKLWIHRDPSDVWEQPDFYYRGQMPAGRVIYQEIEYNFLEGDRSRWFPVYRSFLLAQPLMMYIKTKNGNCEEMKLTSGRVVLDNLEFSDGLRSGGVLGEEWRYMGKLINPPGLLDGTRMNVSFGKWRSGDPPEEKYRFFGFSTLSQP